MGKVKPDHELFDTKDVHIDFSKSKNINEITLVLTADAPFNLMKFYLALKDYVQKMEDEMGVLESPVGLEH